MNIIIGAAGFAKEVEWLIYELQTLQPANKFKVDYFVGKEEVGTFIQGIEVISDQYLHQLLRKGENHQLYIAVGSPVLRKKLHDNFREYSNVTFPSLIDARSTLDKRKDAVKMGSGAVICAGNILTTNIILGDFVHINLNCTVGHDSVIGDYCTLSPHVSISGNVKLGNEVFLGTGAIILEHVQICEKAIVGAGAVVAKNIVEPGTYVGVPAKRIK